MKIIRFSKKRFLELSNKRIIQLLLIIAKDIETAWDNESGRQELLNYFCLYLAYLVEHEALDLHKLGLLSDKVRQVTSLNEFICFIVPLERSYHRGLYDHDFLALNQPDNLVGKPTMPLSLVLDNIRSAFNIGAIFRTAECLGVEKLYLCGYTATPDDAKIFKTAMGTSQRVSWQYVKHINKVISILKQKSINLVALETGAQSLTLYGYKFLKPCALVVGNERFGLGPEVLSQMAASVQIPMAGSKNSLNVAVATGVCGFEIGRQWGI